MKALSPSGVSVKGKNAHPASYGSSGRGLRVYRQSVSSIPADELLERERELGMLREMFARARSGEGMLLLVEGPAGIGKTALAREARAEAEREGMTTLTARSSELEQHFAFGVVRQMLEPFVTRISGLFADGALPAARLFGPDQRRSLGADVGFEALHSLYWLMVNITDLGPALVLVDDCQWADRDSLRFLTPAPPARTTRAPRWDCCRRPASSRPGSPRPPTETPATR